MAGAPAQPWPDPGRCAGRGRPCRHLRFGAARAQSDRALPLHARARGRDRARGAAALLHRASEDQRPDRAQQPGDLHPRAGDAGGCRGRAEGGAVRGGSRRPQRQALRRLCHLAHRNRDSGPGQPSELAVRADVEVPERKLTMTWSLRRNTDKSLPASHTVEIIFKLPADFAAGGISNVPGILMKSQEQTRGVPLSGLAVKVTNGFFLIGLSSVDADKERNLQLLKDRGWFDIPVVYNNNRRAILALEKGTPGDRVFAEAFKVWKQ